MARPLRLSRTASGGLLTCPKDLVTFTTADGAGDHDAVQAPRHRNEVLFDWLDDVM
ncbi:hypothetical protein [Streptomyces sp. 3213.3]|uniref:hypothetical protein n=1 Tax=Streptomyces sp. 3213.3 TaxID=1855348 RepID=UPI001359E6E4|nr:hypothetical protein [Streptomyces sp. 3213.3]